MSMAVSMRLPYFHQHGSSKRRTSTVSHTTTSSSQRIPPQKPLSRKPAIKSRTLSLHSLKSALVDAHRSVQTAAKMSAPPSNPAQLAPPQPVRPASSRSSSAQSVKSAVGHFTESVRPSVSKRDSQAELPAPVHHLGAPANTPRQPSSDNLRSGLAGPMTGKGTAE